MSKHLYFCRYTSEVLNLPILFAKGFRSKILELSFYNIINIKLIIKSLIKEKIKKDSIFDETIEDNQISTNVSLFLKKLVFSPLLS